MKKKLIGISVMAIASGVSFSASAMLTSNAVLLFNDGINSCAIGDAGTFPNCNSSSSVASGSYFAMDTDGNGSFSNYERVAISRQDGVIINAIQPGYSEGGYPGYATGTIDKPFSFLGEYGVHQTTSPVTILSDDGAGHVNLNFSGWGVTWNGIPDIPLGGGTWGDTGIATLVCSTDCSLGDTFTLNYAAHVTPNDPSNFGDVYYGLHLEGTIGAVPVPAAVWLFGSGLLGLTGAMKRRKAA